MIYFKGPSRGDHLTAALYAIFETLCPKFLDAFWELPARPFTFSFDFSFIFTPHFHLYLLLFRFLLFFLFRPFRSKLILTNLTKLIKLRGLDSAWPGL